MTRCRTRPVSLTLGSTFSMHMKMGLGYVTRNRVVEFNENRFIAWHHFALFVWRYDLEAVDGGTMVTESFDYDRPWAFVDHRAGLSRTQPRGDGGDVGTP